MSKIWNPEAECMSRDKMHALQSERLIKKVKEVYDNVPHYRAKMDEKGVKPEDIRSVDDLHLLPFTSKQDLRDTYPNGLFARPNKDIVEIHATSGTTGKQVVAGYTKNDLALWGEVMARVLASAGGDENSVVQSSYGYGLFTGGLGAHYGAQTLGAMAIPTSSGNTERQIRMMKDLGTTILCCTPSYAAYIGETIKEMGLDISEFKLEAGIFGAEPWTVEMQHEIEKLLNIRTVDVYGLTEIIGPGVGFSCEKECGIHISEDHFIPEIIDPETGEVLPDGTLGELVFTCITKEGMPVIRYRTRDITSLTHEPCECGRTLVRMGKIQGRSDDMLIIRGVNVFPSQVESALLDISDVAPYYMLIVDRVGTRDTLEVQVEMAPDFFSDEIKHLEKLEKEIYEKLKSALGLAVKVKLVEPKSITRSEGKAVRVIDNRKK